jgi:hypothetical protein
MLNKRHLPSITALQCFEAVTRHLSFTRAAEELNLTQSAVSKQVAQLEELLQHLLFRRVRRRLQLTPAGRFVPGGSPKNPDPSRDVDPHPALLRWRNRGAAGVHALRPLALAGWCRASRAGGCAIRIFIWTCATSSKPTSCCKGAVTWRSTSARAHGPAPKA